MNLNLGKMPWYGQLGAFVFLSLAGAGVFYYFYARPAQENINARRAQLASIRVEIDKGMATARRLPEFRRQVSDLEAQLEALKPRLPEEKDVADLLRRIQGMATQSNLAIRGFTPQPVAAKQMYAEWPIGLQLEGTYHNLGTFLERVSKFNRIINVNGFKIRANEKPDTVGASISADCTATTFVLTDSAHAASSAPAAPGPKTAAGAATTPRTN
jgi:type IV pilus assembly protein PilO